MTAVRLSAPNNPTVFSSGGISTTASEIDQVFLTDQPLHSEIQKIWSLTSDLGAPSPHAVASAERILRILFSRAIKLGSWTKPHITLSENNEVVFEWWQSSKKITLYFGDGEPDFVKVWGTDMDSEMDSGALSEGWPLTSLWLWLYS